MHGMIGITYVLSTIVDNIPGFPGIVQEKLSGSGQIGVD